MPPQPILGSDAVHLSDVPSPLPFSDAGSATSPFPETATSPFPETSASPFPDSSAASLFPESVALEAASTPSRADDVDEMESWLSSGALADDDLLSAPNDDWIGVKTEDVTPVTTSDVSATVEEPASTDKDSGADLLGDDDDEEDDDDDDDEFARIMATARKMDARAKARGDSDPVALGGLRFTFLN